MEGGEGGMYVEGVEADMLALMSQVVFPGSCGRPAGCLDIRGPGHVSRGVYTYLTKENIFLIKEKKYKEKMKEIP